MNFGDILISVREKNEMSRKDLAKTLDIPYTTLRNYETNQREPGHELLIRLSKLFSVSVDYLLGISQDNDNKNSYQLESSEFILIKKYRQLDEYGKEITNNVINLEFKRVENEKQIEEKRKHTEKETKLKYIEEYKQEVEEKLRNEITKKHSFSTIYYSDIPVSVGEGYYSMDIAEAKTVELKNSPPKGTSFIIRVTGDSMEPLIKDGDKIFVKSQKDVEIGEIGIFIVNNEFYVKKRGEHSLISLNAKRPSIEIGEFDTVYCKGKFLGICNEDIDE